MVAPQPALTLPRWSPGESRGRRISIVSTLSELTPRLANDATRLGSKTPKKPLRVDFKRGADVQPFDDVQPTLAGLVLRNERLGHAEPARKFLLR